MVSGRPLLYLSLPGVAFILGVFWFRRRNKNRIASGSSSDIIETVAASSEDNDLKKDLDNFNQEMQKRIDNAPTKSMKINGCMPTEDEIGITKLFGKSAPIKILQNGRGSPVASNQPQQQQELDSEVLKAKIQDVEHKRLRSIDEDFENLSSPVDLPDSVNNRVSFLMRTVSCQKDEPIVIKATTTPKISPENSFLESKYTATCEQNNNVEVGKHIVNKIEEEKQADISNINDKENNNFVISQMESSKDTEKRKDAASPSLSVCSMQSADSGKGSSLPRSEATRAKTTYEFFFPSSLIGYLYGKRRSFINQIKEKTSASVSLNKNRYASKVRICKVEGTENEVNAALMMIRQCLPVKRYPHFTMQRIHYALPQTIVPLSTESLLSLQLNLIEGINNDVVVSSVITGGHIFVQNPLHPSHPALALLQKCMFESYTASEAPLLPGIEISAVCVLPVNGVWYRVQVTGQDPADEQRCVVKFLDFGGYMNVQLDELRQIRSDFMGYPFQATECLLSNIEPIDSCWSPEAADVLCKLTKGILLQAQVAGYNANNLPEIYLFACLGPNNVIFINKELVARNLAKWVEIHD